MADDDERSIEEILVSIGWGIGFSSAHDLLRPGAGDGVLLDRAADVALELERAGLTAAAAAIRGAIADFRAGTHRDPARVDGVIEGVAHDAEILEAERGLAERSEAGAVAHHREHFGGGPMT